MPVIADNLVTVKNHIRELCAKAGRPQDAAQLIAVSKTRTLEEVKQAVAAGQQHFGENTMQDALTKIPALASEDLHWHFIGHLQSKKVAQIPGHFQWVHSVDSLKLAQKLSVAMSGKTELPMLNCLVQVNVSGETSKSGLSTDAVKPFLEQLLREDLPGINWRGLMTIGVQGDESETRRAFSMLRELAESCQQDFALQDFDQLSMGMSDDYALAIAEGATLVRIGTAIFGSRNVK